MSDITDFYRRPSLTSELGRHRGLVPLLPNGAGALGAIVRGLLIHNVAAKIRGLPLPAERMAHMQAVGAEAMASPPGINAGTVRPGLPRTATENSGGGTNCAAA